MWTFNCTDRQLTLSVQIDGKPIQTNKLNFNLICDFTERCFGDVSILSLHTVNAVVSKWEGLSDLHHVAEKSQFFLLACKIGP